MTFKQRLKFYFIGFGMGSLMLMVVLNKKGCKGVNALKAEELAFQKWEISDAQRSVIKCLGFSEDSLFIKDVKNCTIDYSASDVHAEPCGKYVLESSTKSAISYTLLVSDCGATAKLLDIKINRDCPNK